MGDGERIEHDEIEAFLETRRELGASYDRELVDAFADRIERAVRERSGQSAFAGVSERAAAEASQRQLVLGIVSIGAGIPITAIAGIFADVPGMAVAWLGIAAVNAAHAASVSAMRRTRPHR